MEGGGYVAAATDKAFRPERRFRRSDDAAPEESAEVEVVARLPPLNGNHADARRLARRDADRGFVEDNPCDRFLRRIARKQDHVQPHRTDRRHRLQFLQRERPVSDGLAQRLVFHHRDERAAQPADRRRGERTAFLHGVVQQHHRRSRTGGTDGLHAHRLVNLADGVADFRRRREGEIDHAERDVEPAGDFAPDQLARPRDAESGVLDLLRDFIQRSARL